MRRERQPQRPRIRVAREERGARHERDIVPERPLQEGLGVRAVRQRAHTNIPPSGRANVDPAGSADGSASTNASRRAPYAVRSRSSWPATRRRQPVPRRRLRHVAVWRSVACLAITIARRGSAGGRRQPADPQARRDDLRERRHRHRPPGETRISRQGWHGLALVPESPYGSSSTTHSRRRSITSASAPHAARPGSCVRSGSGTSARGTAAPDRARRSRAPGLWQRPVRIALDGHGYGSEEPERLQSREVRRRLDEHAVAGRTSAVVTSASACWEPVVTTMSSAVAGVPRSCSRAARSARSSGSPSVIPYCSARAALPSLRAASNAVRRPASSKSSGAGSRRRTRSPRDARSARAGRAPATKPS